MDPMRYILFMIVAAEVVVSQGPSHNNGVNVVGNMAGNSPIVNPNNPRQVRKIAIINSKDLNSNNNEQGKYMIDIQAFVELINRHLKRNNVQPPPNTNRKRNGALSSQPSTYENTFNLPINKHPAILTRSGHKANQKTNFQTNPPNPLPQQIPNPASPPITNVRVNGNNNHNNVNKANVAGNGQTSGNGPNIVDGNAGSSVINTNDPLKGNRQNYITANTRNNANQQKVVSGNSNGQNTGNGITINNANKKVNKKPFDNYFQELQNVVNHMLSFDTSPKGAKPSSTGGKQDSPINVPAVKNSGESHSGRSDGSSTNIQNRGSLLQWAKATLNGKNAGQNSQKASGNTNTQMENNRNNNLDGQSNKQSNMNGNVNRHQNQQHSNGGIRNTQWQHNGIGQYNDTGNMNLQTSGNGYTTDTIVNNVGNTKHNVNVNNNFDQSVTPPTQATNDFNQFPNTDFPITTVSVVRKQPKRRGRKGGRRKKGNKGGNNEQQQGQDVEVGGQQNGNGGGNGNNRDQQSSQNSGVRNNVQQYLTHAPCPEIPSCGSDGNNYLSDCYMPASVYKECDGFCPCPPPPPAYNDPFSVFQDPFSAPQQQPTGPYEGCELNCPATYNPVCTIQGSTYDNDCLRACSGEGYSCEGECPCIDRTSVGSNGNYNFDASVPIYGECGCNVAENSPVCTANGQTFSNPCVARCRNLRIQCSSPCPC